MNILIVDDNALSARKLRDDIQTAELDSRVETAIPDSKASAAEQALQIARNSQGHFDVFLIDDNMGAGMNGSELMLRLRQLSPTSEAIIFTANADEAGKQRAIEGGARAYVPRPVNEKELIWQLRGIKRDQTARYQRDWLVALAEVSKELQSGATVEKVGEIIVQAAPRLGFERARLWLHEAETASLIGLAEHGNTGLEAFRGYKVPLDDMPYSKEALQQGEPVIFQGNEHGPSKLEETFSQQGFKVAIGQRIKVPLSIEKQWIGVLTLDNAEKPQVYNETHRELLSLFGNQAASALERAFDQEKDKKLNAIIGEVMEQATKGDLDSLLVVVREQLGRLMNVANFMAVMVDPDSSLLDFRVNYEADKQLDRQWRDPKGGLVGYLLECEKEALWLPDGQESTYRKEKGIPDCGSPSQCWLGVPLRAAGNGVVGALVVQHYVNPRQYNKNHRDILEAIAEQIAGTVHLCAEKEREAVRIYRNHILNELKTRLRTLIDEQEDAFWALLMKFISDRCGLRFNRVSVYLRDDNSLRGRAGVGQHNAQDAYKEWHCILEKRKGVLDRPCDGADFFAEFEESESRTPTFIEREIKQWTLSLTDERWQAALHFNKVRPVPQKDLNLPAPYRNGFQENPEADCVIAPLRAGDQVLGLVIADNAFNNEPIREDASASLEAVAGYAASVWQEWDIRRRNLTFDQRKQLNDLRNKTLQNDQKELHPKLQLICEKAQEMFEASSVVLYPLAEDGVTYLKDQIAQVGLEPEKAKKDFALRPRQHGLFAYVKRTGTVIVPDVETSPLYFGNPSRTIKHHAFIQDHTIQSFFGMALRSLQNDDPLGVLYINHHIPHDFSPQEETLAAEFANIAKLVLSAARGNQEAAETQRARELNRFRDILETALSPDADDAKVIRALLVNVSKALPATTCAELLTVSDTENRVNQQWHVYRVEDAQNLEEIDLPFASIPDASRAFETEDVVSSPLPKQSEDDEETKTPRFCRLAKRVYDNKEVMGVLQVTANESGSFGIRDQALISELAGTAGLVVGSLRRQRGFFQALLEASEEITSTSSLKDTLRTIVAQVRKAVPETHSVTVWYRNEQGIVVAGAQSGVTKAEFIEGAPVHSAVVHNIMQRSDPLWAIEAAKENLLMGEGFIVTEGVASTAAFPLLYEGKAIGALFFNYGKQHSFTLEEKKIFPIFAAIIATSIRDAQSLESEKHSTRRLKAVLKVAQAAAEGWERQKTLPEILIALQNHFGIHLANATPYLLLYNSEARILELPEEVREFYPPAVGNSDPVRLALGEQRIVCKVAKDWLDGTERQIVNIPDVTDDRYNDYARPDTDTRSELCAGLWRDDKLIGVLVLKSDVSNAFSKEDEHLFELVARQIAAALERAEQVQKRRVDDYLKGAMAWASELAHDVNIDIGLIRDDAYRIWSRTPLPSEQVQMWARRIDAQAAELKDKARDTISEREIIDLRMSELLEERIGKWQPRVCPNTEIQYDWKDTSLQVSVYPEQLWRAVRHLLSNAVTAMNRRGTIWLRSYLGDSRTVVLQVENSGPDIPPEVRQHILREPFSTKKEGGMGLLLANMYIENMGGTLHLEPLPGTYGPVFTIRLPQRSKGVQIAKPANQ